MVGPKMAGSNFGAWEGKVVTTGPVRREERHTLRLPLVDLVVSS